MITFPQTQGLSKLEGEDTEASKRKQRGKRIPIFEWD